MTLREKIADIIDAAPADDPLWMEQAADAILAAVQKHLTSDKFLDEREWPIKAMYSDQWKQFITRALEN